VSKLPPVLDESRLSAICGGSMVNPDFLGYSPESWVELALDQGPVFRRSQNGKDVYVICGHDADLLAWKSPENWIYGPPSTGGEFFMSELGELHVTQLDGPAHRRARKFVLPGFGIAAVTRDLDAVSARVSDELAALGDRRVDMHPELSRIVASALSVSQVKTPLSENDIDLMVSFEEGFITAAGLSEDDRKTWYASPQYSEAKRHAFDEFERIAGLRLAGERLGDSLDLVMEKASAAGESELSKEELTSITYLLLVAGVGNIANMLCTAMWALESQPDWILRLREELTGFKADSLRQGMAKYPILKAVISEVERCYLPAPVVPKMAATDIDFLGYRIPAGADVLHLHGLAHFEKDRYSAPFEFDPARWLEGQAPRANAFGGGVHLCLGMGVTRLYVPLILAYLINDFDWRSEDKPRLVPIDKSIAVCPSTTQFVCDLARR
jgi:cytochrome P450